MDAAGVLSFGIMSPANAHALTLNCPAKVNLSLSVGARDAAGYHPIASWMVALQFGDTLQLRRAAGESRYDIHFADDAPLAQTVDWPLEKDLAHRAHRQLETLVGHALPVSLTLDKRIPSGAGLGGGSSDAAGVLVGLNRLFELELSEDVLMKQAAMLGSDVPFLVSALHEHASAIATGRGEVLQPKPLAQPMHLVLVLPDLHCPTGAVYAAFDESASSDARADTSQIGEMLNDLAEPACRVEPALDDVCQRVAAAAQRAVYITGSGAAMFVIADDQDDAHRLAERITREAGIATMVTRTLHSGSDRA